MSSFVENINYIAKLDNSYGQSVELSKANIPVLNTVNNITVHISILNRNTSVNTDVVATAGDTFTGITAKVAELKRILVLHGLTVVETVNELPAFSSFKLNISTSADSLMHDVFMDIDTELSEIPRIDGVLFNTIKTLPVVASLDSNFVAGVIDIHHNIASIQTVENNANVAIAAIEKADAFANSASGVEVEPGKYSGKHYAIESEESMNDAKKIAVGTGEQTLSDGTIGYSSKHYSEVSAVLKADIEAIQDDIEDDVSDVIKVVMNPEDAQYTLSDGITTGYSAKHYHEKIIDLNAATIADVATTHADVVLTHADVLLTHEDVRLTGLDVDATGADVLTAEAYMDLAEDYKNDALHLATNAKNSAVILSNGGGTAYSARHYAEYAEAHRDTAAEMAADAIKVAIFPIDSQYTLNDNTVDYSAKHYHAKTIIAKNAADGSATAASTSAGLANTSAQAALLSQNAAAGSAAEAVVTLGQISTMIDNFDDRYLGAKAEDPALDNDGEALNIGSIYYNTTSNEIRFYDGTSWDIPEYSANQSAIAADTARVNAVIAQGLSEAAKDIAVTKASEAAASKVAAALSETNAASSASSASIKAGEALASAIGAAASASDALVYKNAASASATSASTSADDAADSAANSLVNANNAIGGAATASAKALEASTNSGIAIAKASEASESASTAATHATTASTKATEASNSAASAESSATIATEKAEAVSELFLGAKAIDPATDNEGGVLQIGAIYYSTNTNAIKVWNGTNWQAVGLGASDAVITFNGRDGAVTLTDSDVNTAVGVDIMEIFDSHSELIVENTSSILALAKSNATGSFGATGLVINMNGTEQVLTFDVHQQSTNTGKFELAEDEITIKATGSYTFLSTVTFEDAGANGAVGTVTFRVRDAGNVYYTHTTTVEISGSDRDTVPFNSLMVVQGGVPITAYITVSCNITGYRIVGFESVLAGEKATGELSYTASHTSVTPVGNIAATDVQAALAELQADIDAINTQLAGIDTALQNINS